MMWTCRCASCDKALQSNVEGFDGKTLFISLDIQRFHSMCNECKHQQTVKYTQYFCTVDCLKTYIADPDKLDKYVKDEVYWGKFYEMNPGPV